MYELRALTALRKNRPYGWLMHSRSGDRVLARQWPDTTHFTGFTVGHMAFFDCGCCHHLGDDGAWTSTGVECKEDTKECLVSAYEMDLYVAV